MYWTNEWLFVAFCMEISVTKFTTYKREGDGCIVACHVKNTLYQEWVAFLMNLAIG